jgi:hypothetical protein
VTSIVSYLKSEPASGDDYLSSPPPASVDRGYHKIQGCVKRNGWTAMCWGRGGAHGIAKMTICKAPYRLDRGLPSMRAHSSKRKARSSATLPHSSSLIRTYFLNLRLNPTSLTRLRLPMDGIKPTFTRCNMLSSSKDAYQPFYSPPRPRPPPPCSGQPWPGPKLFSYWPDGPRPTGPW